MRRSAQDRDGDAGGAGSRHVTSYDVAKLAGVSQSAVSRCFSPGASISAGTRAKVEAAAQRLGYAPNAIARSLITRKSGLVGLVVTDLTLRFSPQIVHDLCDRLREVGLLPLLTTLSDERALAGLLPRLLEYQPQAIISMATVDAGLVGEAARRAVPFVLINRVAPRGALATSIRCNHVDGVDALTQRLLDAGHRRLAFLAGPQGAPVSRERLAGFQRAMRRAHIEPLAVVHADYSYDGGRQAARALLASHTRIDALVCANDAMAIGALDCCRTELGIAVPSDMSITGFDDIAESGHPTRDLTTVRQPTKAMTEAVIATLGQVEDGTFSRTTRLIDGDIVLRGSARVAGDPARKSDPTSK